MERMLLDSIAVLSIYLSWAGSDWLDGWMMDIYCWTNSAGF